MKSINEPISVLARFLSNGAVEPVFFRHKNKDYKVKNIQWWEFRESIWTHRPARLYCICTEDDRLAEIELLLDVGVWQLKRM